MFLVESIETTDENGVVWITDRYAVAEGEAVSYENTYPKPKE